MQFLNKIFEIASYAGAHSLNTSDVFTATCTNIATVEINFVCLGNESSLLDCPTMTLGNTYEANVTAVGVVCREPCFNGDIQLIDGSDNLEGGIELCINGFWGSVCDHSWSNFDVIVACRQLGFSSIGGYQTQYSHQ